MVKVGLLVTLLFERLRQVLIPAGNTAYDCARE